MSRPEPHLSVPALGLLSLSALALLGGLGCQHTADGMEKDAAKNSATLKAESKELGKDAAAGAEKAAEAVSDVADAAALQASAAKATFDVKTALMADETVDASRIDVDSDSTLKIVHLRGKVATMAEIHAATLIATDKAAGWRISNELVVAPKEAP